MRPCSVDLIDSTSDSSFSPSKNFLRLFLDKLMVLNKVLDSLIEEQLDKLRSCWLLFYNLVMLKAVLDRRWHFRTLIVLQVLLLIDSLSIGLST